MGIWQRINTFWFTVSQKLLRVWVKTHVVGNSAEEIGLDHNNPVVYAFPNASFSAQLVADFESEQAGFPNLNAPLELADIREIRRSFHLSRLEGPIFRKRYVPHQHPRLWRLTSALEQNPELDVQIVPVSVFWGRAPDKERSLLKLWLGDTWAVRGPLRTLITIAFNGRSTFIQFSKPLSLRALLNEGTGIERTVHKTSRLLRVHFRQERAAAIGPDLSHRRTLVHKLINRPLVDKAIQAHMEETGLTRELVEQKALDYGDEIASNQSYTTIRILDAVLTWVWNKIYNGVKVNNIQNLKDHHQDHEVIYLPCHRSHIDYLLLSYVLYKQGFATPQIAAGINLNLPFIGSILRRGGAFFMRRSFKDNPLYAAVFDEYLHSIFTQGYSAEYFVEGGRSRTGRMLQPRAGMLAMTLRSYLRDSSKPILLMPVYIGYEKIFEASSYVRELKGKAKKKESVIGLIRTLKSLRKNFGMAHVNFGNPIFLTDHLNQQVPEWKTLDTGEDFRPPWVKPVVNQLSNAVVTQINAAAVVTPINLIATVLLASSRQAMTETALLEQTEAYKGILLAHPYSSLIVLPEGNASDWLKYAESLRCVSRIQHPMGDILSLDETNAILLSYFRNNIQHLFALPSMLACFFVSNYRMSEQQTLKLGKALYHYLKAELFLHWDEDSIETEIKAWLGIFKDKHLLREVELGVYERPYINANEYLLLASLSQSVIQVLERYFITISTLTHAGSGTITQSELALKCSQMAHRVAILYGLSTPDFSDKSTFRDMISQLIAREALTLDSNEKLCFGNNLEQVLEETQLLLDPSIRNSILQATDSSLDTNADSNHAA